MSLILNVGVKKAVRHVVDNFDQELTLEDLAQASGVNKFNLCRCFKKRLGMSPMKWLWAFRTHLSKEFLAKFPSLSLTDVAFTCGFQSSAHYSRTFKQYIGVTPSIYRKENRSVDSKRVSSIYENSGTYTKSAYDSLITELSN